MTQANLNAENFYTTTLTSSIPATSADGTFSVASPPSATRGWVVISPSNSTLREVVYFYDRVGSTLYYRGVDRPTPKAHSVADVVQMNSVAEYINYFDKKIGTEFNYEKISGLDIKIFGGTVYVDGGDVTVSDNTFTLSDNTTNYLYFRFTDNTIQSTTNLSTAQSGYILYDIVTLTGNISSVTRKTTVVFTLKGLDPVFFEKDATSGLWTIVDESITNVQIDKTIITGQTALSSLVGNDTILVSDTSDSSNLKEVTISSLSSTVAGLLTTADISDSTNKRYVTDAQLVVIGNTSGVNSGDETASGIKTKYESNADTNAFTDAEKANLANQSGTNTGDQDLSDLALKAGINEETITANKTLVSGTDDIYQFITNTINYDIVLDTASASAGDIFVIKKVNDTSNNLTVKQSTTTLDLIYFGAVKTFVFDGTNWQGVENGTKDEVVAVGYSAKSYSCGSSVGYIANGSTYGAAMGYNACGCNYGVAVGYGANGFCYGVAVGRAANGYNCGAAVGCSANGWGCGVAVGYSTNGICYGVSVGYDSCGCNCGAAVGCGANGYNCGAAIGYCSVGFNYGSAVGYSANGAIGAAVGYSANGSSNGASIGRFAISCICGAAVGDNANASCCGVAIGCGAQNLNCGVAVGFKSYSLCHSIGMGFYSRTCRVGEYFVGTDTSNPNKFGRGEITLTGETTNDTETEIFTRGEASNRLTLLASSSLEFEVHVSAYNTTDGLGAVYMYRGGIRRDASANTALIGTVDEVFAKEETGMSGCSVSVEADDINEALIVKVTGIAAKTIKWNATIKYAETRL